MTSCRTDSETVSRMKNAAWIIPFPLLQPSVSGIAVSLFVSGLTADIFSTLCDRLMVQGVKFKSE